MDALFQKDSAIVMTAVSHDGLALQYAATTLHVDLMSIVLAAVTQNGAALEFAISLLNSDREIVVAVRDISPTSVCSKYCRYHRLDVDCHLPP